MVVDIAQSPHAKALGVEMEIGGTAGDTHERVLERTLGHERALEILARRGPPPIRLKKG